MKIVPVILIMLLSGCATFVTGAGQSITVSTPDSQGSKCSLTDTKGREWHIENTPGTVLVRKGDGPIYVVCKKEGYEPGVGVIEDSMILETMGNIVFPPGFLIDSLTGSSRRYDDSAVAIEMERAHKK